MKKIAMIPARYAATRFPAKLMQDLGGKSVIAHTYLGTLQSNLFDEVYVVTDSDIIEAEMLRYNGKVLRSTIEHECGTDRIAEHASLFSNEDLIVNVQGDEPFTNKDLLSELIQLFINNHSIAVATLKQKITVEEAQNPNIVKLITNLQGQVITFSRSLIPYHRDTNIAIQYYKHIGIYAFKAAALQLFATWAPTPIELLEKQEGMRIIENGMSIQALETDAISVGIDTPEDLVKARSIL